jgi:hypothetical protein
VAKRKYAENSYVRLWCCYSPDPVHLAGQHWFQVQNNSKVPREVLDSVVTVVAGSAAGVELETPAGSSHVHHVSRLGTIQPRKASTRQYTTVNKKKATASQGEDVTARISFCRPATPGARTPSPAVDIEVSISIALV